MHVQPAAEEILRTTNCREARILKHSFTPETVQKVYELPFQKKYNIKITMFQYKIIHNILATKMSLFRAKTIYVLNALLMHTLSIICSYAALLL